MIPSNWREETPSEGVGQEEGESVASRKILRTPTRNVTNNCALPAVRRCRAMATPKPPHRVAGCKPITENRLKRSMKIGEYFLTTGVYSKSTIEDDVVDMMRDGGGHIKDFEQDQILS